MAGIIAFSVAILNLILGVFVLLKNPRGATHRYFLLLSLVVAAWSVANYLTLGHTDELAALLWIRVVMIITSFLGLSIFLLVYAFPHSEMALSKKKRLGLWSLSMFSALLAASPFMFTDVVLTDGAPEPTPGPAMIFFALNFFGTLIAAFIILILKYRRSNGLERTQLRYLLGGIIVSFSLLTITNFVFVVLMQISDFVIFGPAFTLVFIGSIGYAIVRHRFLDISYLVARSVAYLFLIMIVAAFYTGSLFSIQRLILEEAASRESMLVSVFLTLIIVFTFQPLKRFLERLTERIFYRRGYDANVLLRQVNRITTSQLDLDILVKEVSRVVREEMKIEAMAVLMTNGDNEAIHIRGADLKDFSQEAEEIELQQLAGRLSAQSGIKSGSVVIFDELKESPLKRIMRQFGIAGVLPLVVNREVIGFAILRAKLSGEFYSLQDIRVLELLAPQLAISIRNARSFEEIKGFNIKLKQEIDKATGNLRQANHRLKELDKLKDDFVSMASHELRTPMAAIKSYLWMLLAGKVGKLKAEQHHYVERCFQSTERLIKLVNDMLNVSRIESGRISLEVEPMSMVELAQEVVEEVKPRADELGINVQFEMDDHEQGTYQAVADADKIREVIINLMGNSLKFTPKGGRITLKIENKNDKIITHVSDNGIGISEFNLHALFQKFGLIKDSYQTNQEVAQGTGLGLYICKSIINLHKGKIWVESEGEGKGSTFSFSLPKFTEDSYKQLHQANLHKKDVGIIHTNIPA
jgi:signal transduction histidine kinase